MLDDQEAAAIPRVDPAAILKREGFEWTNGYRTKDDIIRLRRQGYKPANDSRHLDGDAVDLTHPTLSPTQQEARLKQLFGDWRGAQIRNEGDHRHLFLPGWGQAPGTPGTPYSGLPDLPKGATLVRRGALTGKEAPPAATGQVHDGDTLGLTTGRNGRLFGADAYELNQQGRRPDNSLVPLGRDARDFMASRVSPNTPVHPTGAQSYGRPVVTLGSEGDDPAKDALRLGHGLAAPEYLKGSPQFGPYMEAERLARLNRLGGQARTPKRPRNSVTATARGSRHNRASMDSRVR
jgi:endonuclease YncB( thermonuclease family)